MHFNLSTISYQQTGYFSKTIIDYLEGNSDIKPFINNFPSAEGFRNLLQQKSKQPFPHRSLLHNTLIKQYEDAGIVVDAVLKKNIQALLNENTYTVTTGHQLCLFTGPLYFIYKIISSIKLAENLKKQFPEINVVPVYWMATEDHDFEEINHVNIFNKQLKWNNERAKGAVGRLSTETMVDLINELKIICGDNENAHQLITIFENAYLKRNNLADATRFLVNELFGHYGLIVVDGDDVEFKKVFSPFIANELVEQKSHSKVVAQTAKLEALGYKAQIKPREINLFYIDGAIRERIELLAAGNYKVLNTDLSFTKDQILKFVNTNPERFSPNVVLRPLYQEVILPDLAYIGGGGELAYWFQLKQVFDLHGVLFPVLILRNSVLWIDEINAERINKLGFTSNDLFRKEIELTASYLAKLNIEEISLTSYKEELISVFNKLVNYAVAVDASLKGSVEAELQKVLKGIDVVESKLSKAQKLKHEQAINQIKNLKQKLFPKDGLQERHDNFIPYHLKYGTKFIEVLHDTFDPLVFKFLIIEVKK